MMRGRDAEAAPAVYELTIKGGMGPVIRSALTPSGVSRSDICTILRVAAPRVATWRTSSSSSRRRD